MTAIYGMVCLIWIYLLVREITIYVEFNSVDVVIHFCAIVVSILHFLLMALTR